MFFRLFFESTAGEMRGKNDSNEEFESRLVTVKNDSFVDNGSRFLLPPPNGRLSSTSFIRSPLLNHILFSFFEWDESKKSKM